MNYDVVEVVIDKTVKLFKLRDWQYDIEDFVEDIADALRLIGAAKVYEDKVAVLTVNGRMARLPLDHQHTKELNPSLPYTESGSFLQIDVADGTTVNLEYQAMPVDTRGYILVPDAVEVQQAIIWYLAKVLALQGELKTVTWQQAEQEWQWRCGSARAALNTWSVEQAFKVYQNWTRLNPIKDAHYSNYNQIGKGNTLNREKNLTDYRTN